jgi:hypothetical protein
LPAEPVHQYQPAQHPENNKKHIEYNIGNLAKHAKAHIGNLTALRHIFGIKTHGNNPSLN